MKARLVKVAIMLLLTACGNVLETDSPLNRQLDMEIKKKVLEFPENSAALAGSGFISRREVEEVNGAISKLWKRINLFDSSIGIQSEADSLFAGYAFKYQIKNPDFIKISSIHDKSQAIVGIKRNELNLLDQLFQTQKLVIKSPVK